MRTWIGIFIILAITLAPKADASNGSTTFILSIGEDTSFDQNLKKLNFSSLDSKRFARAMEIVANVPTDQIKLANNITLEEFRRTTEKITKTLNKDHSLKRFILFFSGHSDERGLHFRDGLFAKEELHSFLKKIPAQTKISILDSCYSGALAAKGIEPSVSEFTIPKSDFDEPTGTVFLTASSADEGAFESKRFESSVFSNYLLSGLYGSADLNNDGLVTIDELYQFIYQRTRYDNLMLPQAVQQQPEFVSKLQGRGALVLSTPKSNLQTLQIDPNIKGEIRLQATYGLRSYIVTADQRAQNTVRLPSGEYNFSVQSGRKVGHTSFKLQQNRPSSVTFDDLEWTQIRDDGSFRKGPEDIDITSRDEKPAPLVASLSPEVKESRESVNSNVNVSGSLKTSPSPEYNVVIAAGTHSGYFDRMKAGPFFEAALASRNAASRSGSTHYATYVAGNVRQNKINGIYSYTADEQGVSVLLGETATFNEINFLPDQTSLHLFGALGMSHVTQKWHVHDDPTGNTSADIPILQLGGGLYRQVTRARIGLSYRKELSQVNYRAYGPTIPRADIVTLSVLY